MRRAPTSSPSPAAPRALPSAAALALLLVAAGCSEDDAPYFGTTLRPARDIATFYVNNGAEPEYLDPGKSSDGASTLLITHLFEGLTTLDPRDAHPVQGVATRWDQSDDNRLFRFHLRPDARWSDSAQVTAFDFEYAWRRVLRPATASRAVGNLYLLKNAELFSSGALKVTARALTLRAGPSATAKPQGRLEEGIAVRILARSSSMALVERYVDLPTYAPRPALDPAAAAPPPLSGYVDEQELREDPSVVGVRAPDALTLEVELEQPTPYFTDVTSYPTLYPVRQDVVETFEQRGESELWFRPENIVTNGPYTLDTWKFRDEITMKRSPFYWNRDALKIHKVVWLEIEDYRTTMNLYKAGEIDYIGDNVALPAEYMPMLKAKRDYFTSDYLGIYWYELNTRKPPLDDVRVRHALNLAIDKKQLVERVTRGGQQPATHYVPDFTGLGYADAAAADKARGADPFAGPAMEHNPARARALMKEAGYEVVQEGDSYRAQGCPPVEILLNPGEGHKMIAVAIQDMWKRNLGVTATLRVEEFQVMLKSFNAGQFQMMRYGWRGDYNHPHTFLDLFRSTSAENHTGWSDATFDAALRRAAETAEPRESIRRYREAEALAVQAMPRLPLYFYTRSTLVKPWVRGFSTSVRGGHLAQYLWIDPSPARPLEALGDEARRQPAFPPREFPTPGVLSP